MRSYIYFLAFFLLSCVSNSSNKQISFEQSPGIGRNNLFISRDSSFVNVLKIKKKYQTYSTSTILPNSETKEYCKPDSFGFYGFYTLIDSTSDLVGYMTIFNSGVPENWYLDNDNDQLIMLDYRKGDMTFFNGIRLGMSEIDLIDHLKSLPYYKNDTLVHADFENMSIDFHFRNNYISSILINCRSN